MIKILSIGLISTFIFMFISYYLIKSIIFTILSFFMFILLAILISIIKFNNNNKWSNISNRLIQSVNPLSGNLYNGQEGYRLGDMVQSKYWRNKNDGRNYHYNNFPDSIVTEYMKKTDDESNIDLLSDIVNSRKSSIENYDNLIVIHLRTGDVIELSPYSVTDMLTENKPYSSWNFYYVSSLPYLDKKVRSVPNIKKIILVAGSQYKMNTNKSMLYIGCVKKYFEDLGYQVETRIGQNADEDFIFMCKSKYFIHSIDGGYGKLISKIVKNNGNTVL